MCSSDLRLTAAAVQISFKPVTGASSYEICKYDKGSKKYKLAYRIKGTKLYIYKSKTKKWEYLRKIQKSASGKINARLTGMKQEEKNQKYYVKALASQKGYAARRSGQSKIVKVK